MSHAFKDLELYRVWVDIPEYNTHARNMFEGLGFQHEGTLRQNYYNEGKYWDSTVLSMLKSEFQKLNENELIIICDVGAYGSSLSSNYNLRSKPAEILIKNSRIIIAKKRQKLRDFI